MPEAGLEPARPKTGDFKTSATPFIPICADPATIGVCAETVASVDLTKNSILLHTVREVREIRERMVSYMVR